MAWFNRLFGRNSPTGPQPIKVLVVCRANICRSPMAMAMLANRVQQRGLGKAIHVSSAGVADGMLGLPPDFRVRQVLDHHQVPMPSHRAQCLTPDELTRWDYILVADRPVLAALLAMAHQAPPKGPRPYLQLLTAYTKAAAPDLPNLLDQLADPQQAEDLPPDADVPDPYLAEPEAFVDLYHQLDALTQHLYETLEQRERERLLALL